MYNYNNDELKHYGVLGMKWGVHRAKVNAAKASAAKSTSKQLSKEIKELKGYEENAKKTGHGSNKISTFVRNKQLKSATKMQQDLNAKADKYERKSNKIMKKHVERSGKSTVNRVSKMSVGKTLVQSTVFGTYGALKYNQVRSKHKSRGRAAVNAAVASGLNLTTGGLLSFLEPRVR